MKKLALLLLTATMFTACGSNQKSADDAEQQVPPKVYMTTDISPEGLLRVYEALGVEADGRVAVKISTGEPGGKNYLKPELIGRLVQSVDGTIVECNTAYRGRRFSSEEHLKAAREHGFFAIADVDIMDTEGEIRIPVQDTTHLKYNLVGKNIENYDFMINLAHFRVTLWVALAACLRTSRSALPRVTARHISTLLATPRTPMRCGASREIRSASSSQWLLRHSRYTTILERVTSSIST